MKHRFDIFEDITYHTLSRFAEFIKRLGSKDTVEMYICSYGGDVFCGTAIFQMMQGFQKTGVKFNAHIYGLCASSASDIALMCDHIGIASTAAIMIHSAWQYDGKQDKGIQIANDAQISAIHKRLPDYDYKDLEKDRWFKADEALKIGLVDYIFDDTTSNAAKIAAKLSFNGGANMKKAELEEIKKDEEIIEAQEDELKEVEEIKEDPEPSLDDVLEEMVKRLEEVVKRLDDVERRLNGGDSVEAECGDNKERGKMKAVFDRIQAICKPCQIKAVSVSQDPNKDLEKHKAIYKNSNFDSYINKD